MSKKLHAELWDKVQFLFRNYYDRMMHAVLYYDGQLDIETIKESISYILERVPVLHSSFKYNIIKPYWKINKDYSFEDYFSFIETENEEECIDKFICGNFSEKSKVQLRLCVVRSKGKDNVCLLINHMCFDGGDFKVFMHKLVECYNAFKSSGSCNVNIKCGSRSASQVYWTMTKEDAKVAKNLYHNVSHVKDKVVFPFTKSSKLDTPRIIKSKIKSDDFIAFKTKIKEMGGTVNDGLITAYIRAIAKICNLSANDGLSVPSMMDLRRHIASKQTESFTNLTGFMLCTLEKVGSDFDETFVNVKKILDELKKDKFVGLSGIPLLKLAFGIFPQFIAEIAIRIGYTNPHIGMSNIGIIDDKEFIMDSIELRDAFMTGALKYKPYMQLALTTFRNEVTMTCAVRVNDEDEKKFKNMFTYIDEEIQKVINK